MPYSAVTQPRPWPLSQGGSRSSKLAVTSTCVSPNFTKQEPSAYFTTPRSRETLRSSSACRPLGRLKLSLAAHHSRMPGLNKVGGMVNLSAQRRSWTIGLPRRPDRHCRGQPRLSERALARDFPPDRRELSGDRRAAGLAQSLAHPADPAVAGFGA